MGTLQGKVHVLWTGCSTERPLISFRCDQSVADIPSLETFVLRSDDHLYHSHSGLARLIALAEVRLVNSFSSLGELHDVLAKLDLVNEQRLRPSWDQYFMQLASLAAQRSNCMKRRVGCVLVREKRVISTGYNGTPRNLKNCNEGGCRYTDPCYGSGSTDHHRRFQVQRWPELWSRTFNLLMHSRRRKCSPRGWEGEDPRRFNVVL